MFVCLVGFVVWFCFLFCFCLCFCFLWFVCCFPFVVFYVLFLGKDHLGHGFVILPALLLIVIEHWGMVLELGKWFVSRWLKIPAPKKRPHRGNEELNSHPQKLQSKHPSGT